MVRVELSEMFHGRGIDPFVMEVGAAVVFADCVTDYQGNRLATKHDGYWIRTDRHRKAGWYRTLRIHTNGG